MPSFAGDMVMEVRELKAEMQHATERLGRLEKRLRALVQTGA